MFLTLDSDAPDPQAAPVIAQVRDAPLQKLVFGVGISTDSGPRLSIDHSHNRLPALSWRAVSKLALDNKRRLVASDWTALPSASGWRWFSGAQLQRESTGSFEVNSTRLRAARTQNTDHIDRSYYLQHDTADSQGIGAPASSSAWPPVATTHPLRVRPPKLLSRNDVSFVLLPTAPDLTRSTIEFCARH